MKQPPAIIVQLVHIEGPLKGEIQEYPEAEISIGRNPSCNVRFPKDIGVISRQHARIVREGNRFKVIDQSSNGTYLNGKAVSEAYLRDGDVLMFAEGGPKVSFLTQTVAGDLYEPVMAQQQSAPPQDPTPQPRQSFQASVQPPDIPQTPQTPSVRQPPPGQQIPQASSQPVDLAPLHQPAKSVYTAPDMSSSPVQSPSERAFSAISPQQVSAQRVKKPLFIQYGPTLRSFNELPVTIGQGSQCDFVLNHPSICERHAQIFFNQEQYWIKDLSGKNPILINGQPVDGEGKLEPECRLSLSPWGPEFRFLGGGRLAEIEAAADVTPEKIDGDNMSVQQKSLTSPSGLKEIGGMIKRFLKK